jgi:hypothetical protein
MTHNAQILICLWKNITSGDEKNGKGFSFTRARNDDIRSPTSDFANTWIFIWRFLLSGNIFSRNIGIYVLRTHAHFIDSRVLTSRNWSF